MHIYHIRQARMALALASVLAGAPFSAIAGDAYGQIVTVVPGRPAENWTVQQLGTLNVNQGASTLGIFSIWGVVNINGGTVRSDDFIGLLLANRSEATIQGASVTSLTDYGLAFGNAGGDPEDGVPSRATITTSAITGASRGVYMDLGGTMDAIRTTIAGTSVGSAGIEIQHGTVTLTQDSTVSGVATGVQMGSTEGSGGPRTLLLDHSSVLGQTGSGVAVEAVDGPGGATSLPARITLVNGSTVTGGNGTAVDVAAQGAANLDMDASTLQGDVSVAEGGRAVVTAAHGARINGAMNGGVQASLASAASWNLSRDSAIESLQLSDGQVNFLHAADAHVQLTIAGDFSGTGGGIHLNTVMNSGGPIDAQSTDRLVILGDVTTTGTTVLSITPSGEGAVTDLNRDGVVDAHEGISLVQVAGASRADAFALAGTYVAAGPYQYMLHAFGPGETDPAQSASGALVQWDYRLGNVYVCQDACEPEPPVDPDPGNPGDGDGDGGDGGDGGNPGSGSGVGSPDPSPGERIAVVPQVPSYLSAPVALLNYGDAMTDGLHQRLGDIRQAADTGAVGGEAFARYLGGQYRYASDRSFEQYGYDFDQQINALQVGASLVAFDTDHGSLRAGFAADKGTTRVSPQAADGVSSAKYDAHGVSGWVTWQHGSDFWIDAVVGSIRYDGTVSTDLRGADVARLRGTGWTGSVEAGLPIALGGEWTVEPRFMLSRQSVTFRDLHDADGLSVHLGTAARTTGRLGARIERTANPVFMPYARIDLSATTGGTSRTDVSSTTFGDGATFGSGRGGNAYHVAAGAVSQLAPNVQLYGEGTYEHYTGGFGLRGWAGNLGVRVSF